MPNSFLGLFVHPVAVKSHVFGEPLRAVPVNIQIAARIDRWLACKSRRDLDHRLVNQYRYWIEIARTGREAESLRLQRNSSASSERIVEGGQIVAVEQLF